jgi:hypothetical protein
MATIRSVDGDSFFSASDISEPTGDGNPEKSVRLDAGERRDDLVVANALIAERGGRAGRADVGELRVQRERGAVVRDVGHHHREDDPEDQDGLSAVREALLMPDDAVVEEDEHAGHDEHGDDVFRELVDLSDRLRRPQDEEVPRRIEPTSPEDERPEEEDHEPDEDQLVSDPGGLVIRHLLLRERVAENGRNTLGDPIEAIDESPDSHELPSPHHRPDEERVGGHDEQEHDGRVHRMVSDI